MCGRVTAYGCAIVTDGCRSRPHPPCLGTDPSFPHQQEELTWDPRGRCFPSPGTSGQHLASPSQEREMLFWRKHVIDCILFILLYFPFFSPFLPAPKPCHPLGFLLWVLNPVLPNSLSWSLLGLVSPIHSLAGCRPWQPDTPMNSGAQPSPGPWSACRAF